MNKKKISNNLAYTQADRIERNESSIFEITIPYEFGLGKNEIKINLTSDSVKKDSEILIDVIDAAGEPIYYEISPIANVDKSRSVIVEIVPETPNGKCSFILFAVLSNDSTYKCTLDIDVVTGQDSNSEIKFDQDPIIYYQERLLPTQQFTSVSRAVSRTFSGGSVSTQASVAPKQLQRDNLTVEKPEKFGRIRNNSVSNNIGSSSIQQIPSEFESSTIVGRNFAFSSSMKGGTILIRGINLEVPKDASSPTPFLLHSYSASILEVNGSGSIKAFPPFIKQISYSTTAGNRISKTFDRFINQTNFTTSFNDVLTLSQSTFTQSYAVLDLFKLETNSGQIEKIEVSYKSLNNLGTDFQPMGSFELGSPNLLVDSSSLFFDNELGIIEKPAGNFKNGLTDFQSNWVTSSVDHTKGTFVVTSSASNRVADGIKIQQNPTSTGSENYNTFRPKQYHSIIVKEGSTFEVRANVVSERDSPLVPQMDVYISGSFVKPEISSEISPYAPIQSGSLGQFVGSFGRSKSVRFTAEKDGSIQPIFVQRTGIWHVGDIEVRPSKEPGKNVNQSRIFIPMNLNSGSEISMKIEYVGKNGKKSRYSTVIDKIFFTGSKFPSTAGSSTPLPSGLISGSDQLTSSLDIRYHRLGTGLVSGSDQLSSSYDVKYETRGNGIISSSTQVKTLLPSNTVSGSEQLTGSYDLKYEVRGNNIPSSSAQIKVFLPASTVSSSAQIATEITGAFTAASSSFSSRVKDIEGGKLTTYAQTASYGLASGSWNTRIDNLTNATSSYSAASSSWELRINSLTTQTSSYATTGSNTFRGNQTVTGSVSISGSFSLTGSLTTRLTYFWTGTYSVLFDGIPWANMPAAKTSWQQPSLNNATAYAGDFTNLTECRLCTFLIAPAANATSSLIVDYSTDGSSWNVLVSASLGTATGLKDSDWVRMPSSLGFTYVRLTGQGGNGAIDPTFSPPTLLLR